MGSNATTLALLELHIREYYEEPKRIPPKRKRVARNIWWLKADQRWAAEEFLLYLKNSKSEDLLFAANRFAKMMDDFACMEHGDARTFSIAYDVAVDLTNYLCDIY